MFPVFTQSNCLEMGDGELHQLAHLMLCHLPVIQDLSIEYEFYQVVAKNAWGLGVGSPLGTLKTISPKK